MKTPLEWRQTLSGLRLVCVRSECPSLRRHARGHRTLVAIAPHLVRLVALSSETTGDLPHGNCTLGIAYHLVGFPLAENDRTLDAISRCRELLIEHGHLYDCGPRRASRPPESIWFDVEGLRCRVIFLTRESSSAPGPIDSMRGPTQRRSRRSRSAARPAGPRLPAPFSPARRRFNDPSRRGSSHRAAHGHPVRARPRFP